MVGLTKYLIGAVVLIVGASACDRSCEATCRKVLKCDGLPTNELSIGECNAECVRQGEYFEDNEDDEEVEGERGENDEKVSGGSRIRKRKGKQEQKNNIDGVSGAHVMRRRRPALVME